MDIDIAWFFAGAFFVNAIPHFVSGVCGKPFQTPFSRPPGKGLSSSVVNVLWGAFNIVIGYILITRVGVFDIHDVEDAGICGLGGLLMAVMIARVFGKLHGGAR